MDMAIKRPQTMTNMIRSKVEEAGDLNIEKVLVEVEYRIGINDPSRTAAQFEKKMGMMKNIGKKARINEYLKYVSRMQDHHLKLNNLLEDD